MSRKIAFTSLGCDKNRVDSEVMLGILQKNGYTAVADEAEADIIVVNTCCFIKDALEESIETILEMSQYKNPDVGNCKGLIVAGCLGQRYEKEFFDELPEVDAIIGTTAYESIAEVADEILGGKEQVKQLESIDLAMQDGNGKLRVLSTAPYFAYLKISEGCDNRCTYCVIPQMRGRHRSRELESLVEEATLLAQQGVDCQRLLIIGGGVIGVEMASIYNALGKQVTIVEAAERILPPMDREISQNLSMILKKRGVEIYTGAMVSAIQKTDNGLQCCFTYKKEEKTAEADVVLISVGRRPCTAGLFAEGFAVAQTERGFVEVDGQFRTSVPTISAIGDVIGRIQLAHAAEAQGIAAVEYMQGLEQASVNYELVPSCVYTTPEIASVGMTADEAKKAGRDVVTGKYIMNGNAKTIIEQQERGFIKVVFDKETDVLLGAQLMCARATDFISELVTAVSLGLTREQLARTMRPHPTFCEGITEAVEGAGGHSIHTMPSRR